MREVIYRDDQEALKACVRWQKRLGLSDWDVKVKLDRASKMENRQGYVYFVIARKEAVVQLLVPEDYSDGQERPQDHELTLVHELLHLHTVWWDNDSGSKTRSLEEQMIHLLAKAFIEMARMT